MTVVGIDPGHSGGIAAINEGKLELCRPMPHTGPPSKPKFCPFRTADLLENMRRDIRPDTMMIYVEMPEDRKGLSAKVRKTTWRNFGVLEGIFIEAGYSFQIVLSKDWQKPFYSGMSKDMGTKEKSIMVANRLYPEFEFNGHDGLSDAALIATYGWRQLNGEKG